MIVDAEFQKCGLRHAHILVFLRPEFRCLHLNSIDKIISAEIPDVANSMKNHTNNNLMCGARDNQATKTKLYRRRNSGVFIQKGESFVDNRYVVPYNRQLLLKYNAHINVEWCNQSQSVKYLFKYVNKDHDRVTATFYQGGDACYDEIKMYYDCRYLSACEAVWRIFSFDINYREPSVERLNFYLECEEPVVFEDHEDLEDVIKKPHTRDTNLSMGTASYMHRLFVQLLVSNQFSQPEVVWSKTWQNLSDDMLHRQGRVLRVPDLVLDDDQLKNYTLAEIERLLHSHGKSMKEDYPTMPRTDVSFIHESRNILIYDEMNYTQHMLEIEHQKLMSTMTDEQKNVYDKIIARVDAILPGIFFLYGYGGTGMTFIWRALSYAIRSRKEIVLTVASSGIAAWLIPDERTAHSRFGIPIILDEISTCGIHSKSPLAKLVCKAKLIIWDEAPMIHKHCFEALHRSLRDILRVQNNGRTDVPFGGKVVVLGGDFRQILLVIPKGTRQEVVLTLSTNMCLLHGSSSSDIQERKQFSEWVLGGDGSVVDANDEDSDLNIPYDLLIQSSEEKTYLSCDSPLSTNSMASRPDDIHTPEFLNTINASGIPNHKLKLKVGVLIMLLRNLDPTTVLCNGTRLIITKMGRYVLEGKVITGSNIGDTVYIPRLSLTPYDTRIPFKFQ
ncbi:PIF1-like helicase [Medicago truncatula]|uniref:ATP-dependent DNA helicase n=1 Tax=Medicago truncatula TaxID=3880 RepID=A0A072TXP4_MEDTR|nr:PIF1-like helicase [Medicago truncatula]